MRQTKIKKIFIAGHKGLLGSSLLKKLKKNNNKIIVLDKNKLNLINQNQVNNFFIKNKFSEVYISAAKVGGILANKTYPAEFIYNNTMIAANIINSAWQTKVKKLIFIGSSCIYPKYSKTPIKEELLLTGELEKTNEAYAIAKITGIKLCEYYNKQYDTDFRSVMLTNLYGPNDNYDKTNAHVIPSLIAKIYHAKKNKQKEVRLWGTGKPKREFLYVDDAASAIIQTMNINKKEYEKISGDKVSHINIGYGKQISIKELSKIICDTINFNGKIIFDDNFPDGTPKKILNSKKIIQIGWKPTTSLEEGIKKTYKFYKKNYT